MSEPEPDAKSRAVKLLAAMQGLIDERDDWKAKCIEARRVARVLAYPFDYLEEEVAAAVRAAGAYQDSTKET